MINIPDGAAYILEKLRQAGYEAWVVGGCVRDSIMGREPDDWGITTSALPEQTKSLFKRTIDTGIKHGTVTVMSGKTGYEVTTYRIDGSYSDGRHPDRVTFTRSLEEDLRRRDFTINAMAYNPSQGLVDLFGGVRDLGRRLIRCVGDPGERFDEDALRMMRAVRFAAQLDFQIDPATALAVRERAGNLSRVSAERIRTELVKLICSDHPQLISLACDMGITEVILPEFDRMRGVSQHTANHIYDVEKHTTLTMENIDPDPVLRMTMLMHDMGKPDVRKTRSDGRDIFYGHPEASARHAEEIMRRLKFDNHSREKAVRLVRWHGLKYFPRQASVRRALNRVGDDIFEDFRKVQRADILGKNPSIIPGKLDLLSQKEAVYRKVLREGQCYKTSSLDINGSDLIRAGIRPGPLFGAILEKLTERVIDDQSLNDKKILLKLAMQLKEDPNVFSPLENFKM